MTMPAFFTRQNGARAAFVASLLWLSSGIPVLAEENAALGLPAEKTSLNETQALGQRIFYQHCNVCHDHTNVKGIPTTALFSSIKIPGPALYGDLIKGSEPAFHELIANGFPNKMPGFKYSLTPQEIDAILAFVATLPQPPPDTTPVATGGAASADAND